MKKLTLPLLLIITLLLSACGESEPEVLAAAQPIEAGDAPPDPTRPPSISR
ncbi:hypothetical protein [uncultured Halomonas sp.]|uniref:hypothetical protein n=1 Tax=uncultured Halomonas sp. TaxID=173971 RepID=UPI002635DEEB|nr:hypothetical protein [uncultured Halomonas sp.]